MGGEMKTAIALLAIALAMVSIYALDRKLEYAQKRDGYLQEIDDLRDEIDGFELGRQIQSKTIAMQRRSIDDAERRAAMWLEKLWAKKKEMQLGPGVYETEFEVIDDGDGAFFPAGLDWVREENGKKLKNWQIHIIKNP